MIHQAYLTSVSDLPQYYPDLDYADGDVLFLYVKRTFLFNEYVCGIFRLYSGFSTSGKTDDGVLVLESTVLTDYYWERITKNIPKFFDSPITTVGLNGTVTVTHDADVSNQRIVNAFLIDTSGGSVSMSNADDFAGAYLKAIPPANGYGFTYDGDYITFTGGNVVKLTASQVLDPPADLYRFTCGYSVVQTARPNHNNGLPVFIYETSSGEDRIAMLMESGGVYSWETRRRPMGNAFATDLINEFYDDDFCLVQQFTSQYSVNRAYTYTYNSGTDYWDLVDKLWDDTAFYGVGKGALHMMQDRDIVCTKDEPSFLQEWYWLNTYSYPLNSLYYLAYPGHMPVGGGDAGWNDMSNDTVGFCYFWPWAPDTVLGSVRTQDTYHNDAYICKGSNQIDYFYQYEDDGYAGNFTLSGDGQFVMYRSIYDKYYHYQFTKTGDQANLPIPTPTETTGLYGGLAATVSGSGHGGGIFWLDSHILGDYWIDNAIVYHIDTNQKISRHCMCSDIDLTNAVGFHDPADTEARGIGYAISDTEYFFLNTYYGNYKGAIGTLSADTPTSVGNYVLYMRWTDFIQSALTITNPAINSTDVGGAICRFGFLAKDNLTYWYYNGSNWVSTTDPTLLNTKAVFLAAPLSQIVTDAGSGDWGIAVVFHSDGTNSPIFRSISMDYQRAGKYDIRDDMLGSNTDRLEIVSSTQTRYTNLVSTSKDIILRVMVY